ncbi:Uncharacterised protein [Yersinia kristensenii]|nr:Uncharacterised protein [Yersinia kristensenii]
MTAPKGERGQKVSFIARKSKKKCQSVLLTGILSFFIFFVFEVAGS